MSNALREFCEKRKMNEKMKDAFETYIRSSYSSAYAVKPGDTLTRMISAMSPEKVEEMWRLFVTDFRQILVTQ